MDLRARKKMETRRALTAAARSLTLDRGLDAVTVDDIVEVAGVSPRTFFNYFSSKEEAIVGADPTMLDAVADAARARPAGEAPLDVMLAVLVADTATPLAERWTIRTELLRRHPELLPRYLAGMAQVERALVGAIAERLGVDPVTDPYPRLVVTTAVSTVRATLEWWDGAGRPVPLDDALGDAFARLATGLVAGSD